MSRKEIPEVLNTARLPRHRSAPGMETLPLTRRRFLAWLAATGAAMVVSPSHARGDSTACGRLDGRRIEWTVPFSPGGGYDTYSRIIAAHLSRELSADIVVRNMPGAGGIIGARSIRDAVPDGSSLGILNGPGMLIASMVGDTAVPDPLDDFTILGRVSRSRHVWATGGGSPHHTIEELLKATGKRQLLFAIDKVGTASFTCAALGCSVLQADVSFLAGFPGSRQTSLAAMRGDADLVSQTFESIADRIKAGDLRPLLQISASPISDDPALAGVPTLGGSEGFAARRAAGRGLAPREAAADAEAIASLIGAGRLVVAPPGLPAELSLCLESALGRVFEDGDFVEAAARAGRSLDTADAEATRAGLISVKNRSSKFLPVLKRAVEAARQQ